MTGIFFPTAATLIVPTSVLAEVYSGLWSYNAVLGGPTLACLFFPLSPQSVLLATFGVAGMVMAQYAFR